MTTDFLIVQGGFIKDEYDSEKKILNLNCNDGYAGLPEKVLKTFHWLISSSEFSEYTHFCKLDDDMVVKQRLPLFTDDYLGQVHYDDGNRHWHIGRCGNFWDKIPYIGEFKPWCMGGFGYVISRKALQKVLPNFEYLSHIYEDVYIGLLMNRVGIVPKMINNIKSYLQSPDH